MKFLSLFSGIGGMDLGLERAGMKCVGQVEINPYCRAVLAKHWPGVKRMEDVRDVQGNEFGPIGIIAGGFPCQDISCAGKGKGIHAERSGLWWEMRRIIDAVRPAWVLAENVPALRTRGADEVFASLEEIGYAVEPIVVGAWAVGAPHRRGRVFAVASYAKRNEQSREEPRCWQVGRMGREQQPVPWDRPWQVALAEIRGMDDGLPRSVERTDAIRNAVVPQVAEVIGRAIMEYEA